MQEQIAHFLKAPRGDARQEVGKGHQGLIPACRQGLQRLQAVVPRKTEEQHERKGCRSSYLRQNEEIAPNKWSPEHRLEVDLLIIV